MMNTFKEKANQTKNTPNKCGEFTCPDGGSSLCVRVTTNYRKNKGSNQIYIEMINKCELEYMRCYKDYKATVVSMSYCMSGHLRKEHLSRSDLLHHKGKLMKHINGRQKRQAEKQEVHFEHQILHENKIDNEKQSVEQNPECSQLCRIKKHLVCGRCTHNILKTFPSTCHLKRFNCEHPAEEFELVARNPCVLLTTYMNDHINNEQVAPAAAHSVEDDRDLLLKHIICRSRVSRARDLYCSHYLTDKQLEGPNKLPDNIELPDLPANEHTIRYRYDITTRRDEFSGNTGQTEKSLDIKSSAHKENLVEHNASTLIYNYNEGQTDTFTCTLVTNNLNEFKKSFIYWNQKGRDGEVENLEDAWSVVSQDHTVQISKELHAQDDGTALICKLGNMAKTLVEKIVLFKLNKDGIVIEANGEKIGSEEKVLGPNVSTQLFSYREGQSYNLSCTYRMRNKKPNVIYFIWWSLKDKNGKKKQYAPVVLVPGNGHKAVVHRNKLTRQDNGTSLTCHVTDVCTTCKQRNVTDRNLITNTLLFSVHL